MTKVLITGATGNVGLELIKALQKTNHSLELFAGVRDLQNDHLTLSGYAIKLLKFDFMDHNTYHNAISNIDIVFLLRPPQISDVEKYFRPIIDTCKKQAVKHIVFLSVQGVEKSTIIPHHKIEKLIVDSKIFYTFLRPAYFMQNFTTTLRADLVNKRLIYLPAGKAKFTIIDVGDIGEVAAIVLNDVSVHRNKEYDLTNQQKLSFAEMAEILTAHLGQEIQFVSPNLLSFFISKRKEKLPPMLILVMIMLHFLPRFQQDPGISDWVEKILHRPAISFEQFISQNRQLLTQ